MHDSNKKFNNRSNKSCLYLLNNLFLFLYFPLWDIFVDLHTADFSNLNNNILNQNLNKNRNVEISRSSYGGRSAKIAATKAITQKLRGSTRIPKIRSQFCQKVHTTQKAKLSSSEVHLWRTKKIGKWSVFVRKLWSSSEQVSIGSVCIPLYSRQKIWKFERWRHPIWKLCVFKWK
jgi:hypothetical protein